MMLAEMHIAVCFRFGKTLRGASQHCLAILLMNMPMRQWSAVGLGADVFAGRRDAAYQIVQHED